MQNEVLLLSSEKADLAAEVKEKHRSFISRLTATYAALEREVTR
jgi:hypothetical protein